MGDVVDPRDASIDGLIDWLREKRRRDPVSRLSDLCSASAIMAVWAEQILEKLM
jgi:hypothetical protein